MFLCVSVPINVQVERIVGSDEQGVTELEVLHNSPSLGPYVPLVEDAATSNEIEPRSYNSIPPLFLMYGIFLAIHTN